MIPTMEILVKINQNSQKHQDEVFTRLYRYLLREDIYYTAYQKLYSNKGAGTKGINDDTADGFGELKIKRIVETLQDGTYFPKPVRRTYIAKNNDPTKKRPLGLPTFTDKLIQEVIRMILESIYEPIFLDVSHGFRPNRSSHTALRSMCYGFNGIKWFVEGDIKGCFDNINHNKLIEIISRKIKDVRFLQLINKFLNAGYLEDWIYHTTHSGSPQGGIISPILANIYLNELDKFVMTTLKDKYHHPVKRKRMLPDYHSLNNKCYYLRKKIGTLEGDERHEAINELHRLQKEKIQLPYSIQEGTRLYYVRYADDFLIGVDGDKTICVEIKALISEFISNELKMELSDEKTLITHSSEKAKFLGYNVSVRRKQKVKKAEFGRKRRTLNQRLELTIPFEKIEKFLFSKGVVEMKNNRIFPVHRKSLVRLTDLEIVCTFNAEIRGILNYYNLAADYNNLKFFRYCMEYSCLKTLANKYKCSLRQVIAKFCDGKDSWSVPYETKTAKKRMGIPTMKECKSNECVDVFPQNEFWYKSTRSSVESRLKAHRCELCGCEDNVNYEIHHVNKVKNLKGKEKWEQIMIAKRRKTMVLCHDCHMKIHHGN